VPQDYPTQFGRSDLYPNSNGTIPAPPPNPANVPVPLYFSATATFTWTLFQTITEVDVNAAFPPGYVFRSTWTSPAFDLRPDMRSGQGAAKEGAAIWSRSARLYYTLMAPSTGTGSRAGLSTLNLNVAAQNFTAPVVNITNMGAPAEGISAGAGLQATPPTDVSGLFAVPPGLGTAVTSVLVGFAPPGTTLGMGEGYPIRYWRLQLTFDQFVATTTRPVPVTPDVSPTSYAFVAAVY